MKRVFTIKIYIKNFIRNKKRCLKIFIKRIAYTYDYICVVVSNLFDLIPLKINSSNLPWNSFSVDRAEVPVNLRDLVNLQESFVDKSRWTVRDLLEDSQWPVPLFMLQFVDDQIRFEWQTLFAPIFHNAHSSRFESFRNHGISTLPIFDHA